jgi:hypothetical protein
VKFLRLVAACVPSLDTAIDLAALAGAICLVVGAWLIYEPAGVLTLGVALLAAAVLAAKALAKPGKGKVASDEPRRPGAPSEQN